MPWVHWKREKLSDDGDPFARNYLDCHFCLRHVHPMQRRAMGCGHVAEGERIGCVQIDGAPDATICPGYTTSMPQPLEAARALGWRQDGQLREYLGGRPLTGALTDAMDIVASEVRQVERHALRVIREEAKRGS